MPDFLNLFLSRRGPRRKIGGCLSFLLSFEGGGLGAGGFFVALKQNSREIATCNSNSWLLAMSCSRLQCLHCSVSR